MTAASSGPVQRTRCLLWVTAEVQDNGDGTWSGMIIGLASYPPRPAPVVTADSREEVLSLLSQCYSVPEQRP
jgi:hypothetical protein